MNNDSKHVLTNKDDLEMKKHLMVDDKRIQKMIEIKLKVLNKELTATEARTLVNRTFDRVTAAEFAYGEQHLYEAGITDKVMEEGMNDILEIFDDVLEKNDLNLPKGHPIQTYFDEAVALEELLIKTEKQMSKKFIKNEWLELYTQLSEINTHFSRKQNQLFSALERKGFDRPSRIMWTFDDRVRDAIKNAFDLLNNDRDQQFLESQPQVIYLVRDILQKERDVLHPTSLKLLTDAEFAEMRKGDDEIGYCLIETPPPYQPSEKDDTHTVNEESSSLMADLQAVLAKHGMHSLANNDVLDVSNGKLTLDQINLIYKHIQVDLSYVDENDIVKFYTDSKHRIFPRSKGVIGREVQNCHPRESLSMVEAIIQAFRSGEQDQADFWIDKGDQFIYIIFNAVRDEQGNFKGVLEMMQDVTRIRSLKGSRRLLSWNDSTSGANYSKRDNATKPYVMNEKDVLDKTNIMTNAPTETTIEMNSKTVIGKLIAHYPFIKDFLLNLSPEYKNLNNPVVFKTMKNVATLEMISKVGGFKVERLIELIKQEIADKA